MIVIYDTSMGELRSTSSFHTLSDCEIWKFERFSTLGRGSLMLSRFANRGAVGSLSSGYHIRMRFSRMAILTSALCLAACGMVTRDIRVHGYMGIPFDASETSPEIAELARQAWVGSKRAQLQLGEKFECGDGVEISHDKALLLFKLAAQPTKGIQVYQSGLGPAVKSSFLTSLDVESEVRRLAQSKLINLKLIQVSEAVC